MVHATVLSPSQVVGMGVGADIFEGTIGALASALFVKKLGQTVRPVIERRPHAPPRRLPDTDGRPRAIFDHRGQPFVGQGIQ